MPRARHELCEIGSDFGKRLAQEAREQPHDRRIFPRRRGRRNTPALDLPIGGAHPDDRHAERRKHIVIRRFRTGRPSAAS